MSTTTLYLYESRWIPPWGPSGLRLGGWSHVGSLPTGLLRREHCLIRITERGEK